MRGCGHRRFTNHGGRGNSGGRTRGWVGCDLLKDGVKLLAGHVGCPEDLAGVVMFNAEEGVGRERHVREEGVGGVWYNVMPWCASRRKEKTQMASMGELAPCRCRVVR